MIITEQFNGSKPNMILFLLTPKKKSNTMVNGQLSVAGSKLK